MKNSTAQERFGQLARSFGVLLPAGRRYRRPLGLSLAEQYVIEELLYYHRQTGVWASISQSVLAEELGISRTTVNGDLQRLKRSGLVATRSDPRFGRPASTVRYCLDPYVAVLAMWEGHDRFDPEIWIEGNERLLRFADAVHWGGWVWEVDGLRASPSPVGEVLSRFIDKYGASDKLSAPTTLAVPVSRFLFEEQAPPWVEAKQRLAELLNGLLDGSDTDLSVPPTEGESHISTSVHKLKALLPKELETLVHERLKTSELKTLDDQLMTSVGEQPEKTSAGHRRQADLVVAEEVSDWISEQ